MKTLDEVITELTTIYDRYEAEGCFYCSFQRECTGGYCYLDDALHYLKAYKDDRDDLTALRAYWVEQQENKPLSWDELKQMEGKPVWVEESAENGLWWTYWVIWQGDNAVLPEKTYGKAWQAYRKERE